MAKSKLTQPQSEAFDPATLDTGSEPVEQKPPVRIEEMIKVDNLAPMLDGQRLSQIGFDVVRDYEIDRDSMKDWLGRMKAAIELAQLVKKDRNYPFAKASNIKYPLVTTAALQFNAKAYPAIVAADEVVKVKVYGDDPQGQKAARAERVAEHMSYDLDCNVEEWEEDTDNLLTLLPIVGTIVRKWWWDAALGRKRCRLILPGAFVVNDRTRVLSDAPRMTEELPFYPSEIETKRRTGEWIDQDYVEGKGEDTQAPEDFLEQHCRIDLDEDGLEEPYIVTVHKSSRKVARIVADFEAEDIKRAPAEGDVVDMQGKPVNTGPVLSVKRGTYFVAYKFLPSMDGGFHGTGLGLLLGDISKAINTSLNLMFDAGHMQALGGGFIGADFRIKGGSQRFSPGEWKMANAAGSVIKDSVVPMAFPGPSPVLFEMLGVLIEAGKEVASIKDVITGDTGNRTMPVGTTLALIEQGMAQFTAAYKRIFRSLRHEFKLIAKMNQRSVTAEEYNAFHDTVQMVPGPPGPDGQPGPPMPQPVFHDPQRDYDLSDMDIKPVADPTSVTRMQEMGKAQFLADLAEKGLVARGPASQRVLKAANIPNTEELAPQPDPMQQALAQAEVQEKMAKAQATSADAQTKMLEAQNAARESEGRAQELMIELEKARMEMAQKQQETDAKVRLMEAQMEKIRLEASLKTFESQADIAREQRESEAGIVQSQRESEAEIARRNREGAIKASAMIADQNRANMAAGSDQRRKDEAHKASLKAKAKPKA